MFKSYRLGSTFICVGALLSVTSASADTVFWHVEEQRDPWRNGYPTYDLKKTDMVDLYIDAEKQIKPFNGKLDRLKYMDDLKRTARKKGKAQLRVLRAALKIKHGSPQKTMQEARKLLKIYKSGALDKDASALAMVAVAFHSAYSAKQKRRATWNERARRAFGQANRLARKSR